MSRTSLVRWQLLVLAVLTLLVGLRACQRRAEAPHAITLFADMAPGMLYHKVLHVEQPVRLRWKGIGAWRRTASGPEPVAYGWVLRRSDRQVVWQMQPRDVDDPPRFRVQDTLRLAPGVYDVFFTTQGNVSQPNGFWSWLFPKASWMRGYRDWGLWTEVLDGPASLRLEEGSPAAPAGPALLWTAAPMASASSRMALLEVRRPTRLLVYAVGELQAQPADYGWIERLPDGERLWEMRRENTQPAGGWEGNRMARDTVEFMPGVYRAWFQTDAAHAFGNWRFNPPFDVAAWGLTLWHLYPEDTSVVLLDPWVSRRPLLMLAPVGNAENRQVEFSARDTTEVLLYAVGELGTRNRRYDYAWLTDSLGTTLWKMERARSVPAGGHPNNRLEVAALRLPPGRYVLHYQTDDSHAYEDWRNGRPEHPERWGVTLFPLRPGRDTLIVHAASTSAPSVAPPSPPVQTTGALLVDLTRVRNNEHREQAFTLTQPTRLRIRAVGELSLSGQYDYGWIEQAGTGEVVWEMTWQHTKPAGGDGRNRMADTLLTLPAGTYIAHFRTDFSHAYGQFEYPEPHEPEAWGLRIERIDQ